METIDNPGWSVQIDLTGTELIRAPFENREINRSEDDWLVTWVEDDKWHLACGPLNLSEGLSYFRTWVGDTRALRHFRHRSGMPIRLVYQAGVRIPIAPTTISGFMRSSA